MSEEGKGLSTYLGEHGLQRLDKKVGDAETAVKIAVSDLQAWKRIFELCVELRNFEITQLVQRNNFFMIFQGVLLAGICQSAAQIPIVSFMICLVGLFVSIYQVGMAAGAKYWQVHWEVNTRKAESRMTKTIQIHGEIGDEIKKQGIEIDPVLASQLESRLFLIHLFQDNSGASKEIKEELDGGKWKRRIVNRLIMSKFSASRIPIYVGCFLAFSWFVLLMCTIRVDWIDFHVFDFIVGFPKGS